MTHLDCHFPWNSFWALLKLSQNLLYDYDVAFPRSQLCHTWGKHRGVKDIVVMVVVVMLMTNAMVVIIMSLVMVMAVSILMTITSLAAFASMAIGTTISRATQRLITWGCGLASLYYQHYWCSWNHLTLQQLRAMRKRNKRKTSTLSTVTPQGSHCSLNTLKISSATRSLDEITMTIDNGDDDDLTMMMKIWPWWWVILIIDHLSESSWVSW